MSLAFGGLYVTGGAAAQALATSAAKLTGFTTVTAGSSVHGDQSVVPVAASDHVLLKPGTYLAMFNITALVGTADIQVLFTLRNGTTAVAGAACNLEAEASDVPTNTSFAMPFTITADATMSIYAASESATPNLTPVEAQLSFVRLY